MNATAICAELTEIKSFMDRQHSKGNNIDALATSQASQFIAKVKSLAILTSPDANRLCDTFDSAPFSDASKSDFATSIAQKLSGGVVTDGCAKLQQFSCDNYLTDDIWQSIADPSVDITVKAQIMATLFMKNGVSHANESSLGRAAIILATHGLGNQAPTPQTLYNLLTAVKEAIANARPEFDAIYPFPRLTKYPLQPCELPLDRLKFAYGDDTKPVTCPTDVQMSLARLCKVKFMRKSARGVNQDKSASSTDVTRPAAGVEPMQQLQQMQMMIIQTMQRAFLGSHGASDTPLNPGTSNGTPSMDALPPPTPTRNMRGYVPRVPPALGNSAPPKPSPTPEEPDDASVVVPRDVDAPSDAIDAPKSEGAAIPSDPVAEMRILMGEGRAAKRLANNVTDTDKPHRNKAQRISDAAKAGGLPVKKATAGARAPTVLKRPSSAYVDRPKVSLKLETIFYNGGKIRMSDPKQGFRCFPTLSSPVDRLFKWGGGSVPAKTEAWHAALDYIDHIRSKGIK